MIYKLVFLIKWARTDKYIMDMSANIEIRQSFYKVISRWYMTPRKLVGDVGDMLYIWWSCPHLKKYWLKIHLESNHHLKIKIRFLPECYLLHLVLNHNRVETVLLNNLLGAAKIMIAKIMKAKKWNTDETPTIYDWQVFILSTFIYDAQVNGH